MVRDNRVKFYYFPGSPTLYGNATTGHIDVHSDNPINGRIQSVYFQGGNWDATGSFTLTVSGTTTGLTATEGNILTFTSGTTTHNLGEDWVVFPRATTVHTNMTPISGAYGYAEFSEISVWSVLRLTVSGVGTGSAASGLTVVYI